MLLTKHNLFINQSVCACTLSQKWAMHMHVHFLNTKHAVHMCKDVKVMDWTFKSLG